jgi:hypothetical protein
MQQRELLKVVGVDDVLKGLTFINDDLFYKVKAALKPVMLDVRDNARNDVPDNSGVLSGWVRGGGPRTKDYKPFPNFDSSHIKSLIEYSDGYKKVKGGFTVTDYVYNASPGGAIYETAGRLNPQGRAPIMSTSLKGSGGVTGFENRKGNRKRSTKSYSSANPFAGYQFVTDLPPLYSQPKVKGLRGGGRKTKGRLIYKAFGQKSHRISEVIAESMNSVALTFAKNTEIKKVA